MAAKKKSKAIELGHTPPKGSNTGSPGGNAPRPPKSDYVVQPPRKPVSLGRAKDAEVSRLYKQERAYKRPGAMYSPQGHADYMAKTPAQQTAKGRK